jgi:hypothetical protein
VKTSLSVFWLMPLNTSGVAIRSSADPAKASTASPRLPGANNETDETAGLGRFGFHSVAATARTKQDSVLLAFVLVLRSFVEEINHLLDG